MLPPSFATPAELGEKEQLVAGKTSFRTVQVDGLSIFYREAGRKTRRHSPAARATFFFADVSAALREVGGPIIWSRRIIPASDTATGRTRKSLPTPSITSRR